MGKSSRLAIVLAGARVFCLGVLALLLSLPYDSGVGAENFTFSGFQEDSLYKVPGGDWIFIPGYGCFILGINSEIRPSSGRLLYRFAVQMKDPNSTTVKSFSTSFIYRFERHMSTGPGLAFIIVPDNVTLGAPGDSMGLITSETSDSDDHTLGVELDTFKNSEFNDPSDNHIGINLASMTSSYSFTPDNDLVSSNYQQVWIDYSQIGSRMDIYLADYKEHKPDKPQEPISRLDLSLLKEKMFIGFSSATYFNKFSDMPIVCAWSFSNDGSPAPSIVMAQDVGKEKNLGILVGVPVSLTVFVGIIICIIVLRCWCRFLSHPLRIFISHAGGPDGSEKNFPKFLHDRMTRYTWSISKLNVRFFIDIENIDYGERFATKIFEELAIFDVGLVVVTEAFFKGKWPMTELIAFVEAQMNDPTRRLRVFPLFYKLTPENIRDHLRDRTWEPDWEEMTEGNHPLDVEKCRHAVNWLCNARGLIYRSERRDYDKEYIEEVCKCLDTILRKERSFASYIWRTISRPFYSR